MYFNRRNILRILNGLTLALLFSGNNAFAQVVTITGANPMPIPAWAVASLVLLLAALGFWALRKRRPAWLNRVSGWALLAIVSAATLAFVASGGWLSRAQAIVVYVTAINITGIPAVATPVQPNTDIPVTNSLGASFIIGSVTVDCSLLPGPPPCTLVAPASHSPQCQPGLTLGAGNACYLNINLPIVSSRTKKDDIEALSSTEAAKVLADLQPVTFRYKNDPAQQRVGFIAEDVPDLVATNDRETLNAMDIVAVLTKVMQEKSQTIERQQRMLEAQDRLIEAQRSEFAQVKEQLAHLRADVQRLTNMDRTAQR